MADDVERPSDAVEAFFWLTDESRVDDLRRGDLPEAFHFDDVKHDAQVCRTIAQAALVQDKSFVPSGWHERWRRKVGEIVPMFDQALGFQLGGRDPDAERTRIQQQVNRAWNELVDIVMPFARSDAVDWSTVRTTATDAADQAVAAGARINELLETLQKRAGETAADRLAYYYDEQVKVNAKEGARWLGLTIASLGLLGVLVYLFFDRYPIQAESDDQWQEFAREFAPRLIIVGLAAFALTFFARNYRVARHQQAVNEHKRNALDTYGLFVATASEAERDVITQELVRRIFENVETGYITASNDRTVVEVPTTLSAMRPGS